MQTQARAWQRLWDRVVSRERKPGYGNSYGKGRGTTRYDLSLTAPPLPVSADLTAQPVFAKKYVRFLAEARTRMPESDRLIHELQTQLGAAERNRYNIEVFLSIARFAGHHWRLLIGLANAERSFVHVSVYIPPDLQFEMHSWLECLDPYPRGWLIPAPKGGPWLGQTI
jgi:hypothetical protein